MPFEYSRCLVFGYCYGITKSMRPMHRKVIDSMSTELREQATIKIQQWTKPRKNDIKVKQITMRVVLDSSLHDKFGMGSL